MKDEKLRSSAPQTPLERLTDFAKRIVSVPKTEVDKKAREFTRPRKRSR